MINRIELKNKAKESLRTNFMDCLSVTIIFLLISSVANYVIPETNKIYNFNINFKADIISFILTGLFQFGYYSFFLKTSREEKVEIKELWSKINLFIPYLVIAILTFVFTFLWSLLFVIPGIIAMFSYSMVYFVKLDNPEISELDAIKKSKQIMRGHKLDYFILLLSFLGWTILGLFTFGILYLWLIPYKNLTICNFYDEIKELNN